MALRLNVDSLVVESFAAVPGTVTPVTASEWPDCDSFSGGPPCCSEGCADSHTCPDVGTCNRACSWPECPAAAL